MAKIQQKLKGLHGEALLAKQKELMGNDWDTPMTALTTPWGKKEDWEGLVVKFSHKPVKVPLVKFTGEPMMFTSDMHVGGGLIKHPVSHVQKLRISSDQIDAIKGAMVFSTNPCAEVPLPSKSGMIKLKMPPPYVPPIPEPRSAFGKMIKKKIEDSKKVS